MKKLLFAFIVMIGSSAWSQDYSFVYNNQQYKVTLKYDVYTKSKCQYQTQGWKQTNLPEVLTFESAKKFLSSPCNPSKDIVNQLVSYTDINSPTMPLLLKAFADSINVEPVEDILTPFESVMNKETNETGNFILYSNLFYTAQAISNQQIQKPLQLPPSTRTDGKPLWWQDPEDCGPGFIWVNGSCIVHCPPGQEMISYNGGPYKCQTPRPQPKPHEPRDH